MKLTPEDPKLTAYALGELPEHERARIEAALAKSPECQQEVEAIRNLGQTLEQELRTEPCPEWSEALHGRLSRETDSAPPRSGLPGWVQVLGWSFGIMMALVVAAGLFLPSLAKSKSKAQQIAAVSEQRMRELRADIARAEAGEPLPLLNSPTPPAPAFNTEAYELIRDNAFQAVAQNPLSTFSIDVDTASYANIRRFLNQGVLPPKDAVRIEELLNYFTYDYPQPGPEHPFSVNLEVAGCPWSPDHRLVRIGLKGREIATDKRPPSNLVFLVDVSGSMRPHNKLPLLKRALGLLVNQLTENDQVSIVVYAGASGLALPVTTGDRSQTILEALEGLEAGGSTHGSAGIQLAYATATQHLIQGGVNRVILCTDGDFNVGTTDRGSLVRLIEEKANAGVFLSVFGFGMGNLKDATLEQLADKGNGTYGYIDTLNEARKIFVDQINSTLVTLAKDVKIQVEFNPAQVAAYRLVGYENRLLAKEDFNDDAKDAGEIGAGHTVTALYEIVPANIPVALPGVDPLKYQSPPPPTPANASPELLTAKLRYKQPDGDTSRLLEVPLTDSGTTYARASGDFKFAAAVAAFGMILRDSEHKGTATLDAVLELADEGKGRDPAGYRTEFLQLVRLAKPLMPPAESTPAITSTPPPPAPNAPTEPGPEPEPAPAAVPLALSFPMPTLKGTPDELPKGPNIEPLAEKPPAPIQVPAGVKNVALSKQVTGSDKNPITGELSQVTDGDKEAFDDQVVEMRRNTQWVQVDLGEPYEIYAVVLWHDHRWIQLYRDVIVQLADDPDFTRNVRTVYNNDMDNSSGQGIGTDMEYFETQYGRAIPVNGQKARYLRSYTKGSNLSALNCIQEIEVYALPASSSAANADAPDRKRLPLRYPMPALR